MIPIEELKAAELHKARIACAYIFSPKLAKSDEFLKSLNFDILKKAYREKAKKYHPDFNRHEHLETAKKRSERFIKIHGSYKVLSSHFCKYVQTISKEGNSKGKIIAIGGAKGGIGKSLFAANLGVFLSKKGLRTVVVDLDLGGANLHLYLGERFINININDFLKKRIRSLQKAMIDTKYGPLLIGGDSSQLGATNISFMQKLKLLKAIKNIDADYIIIDLGGDTSHNTTDFFLLADHGIVLTTCDPASYLEAYNFIKISLYRKLNRLFGPESKYNGQKDHDLKQFIYESTMLTNGPKIIKVGDLLKKVKKDLPESLSILSEAISKFSPYLIVNKVPQNFNASQIVKRIQEVSTKMLSIKVKCFGSIPYHPEIELKTRNLEPIVTRSTTSDFEKKMSRIVGHFLCN